jgi:hypothetical protein
MWQARCIAISPELERVLDEIEELRPAADNEYFKREIAVDVAGRQLRCIVYEINPKVVRGQAR